MPSPVLVGVVCDAGGVVEGAVDGVDDDGTDGFTDVGTDGFTATGTAGVTDTEGVTEGVTAGVTAVGTDGLTGDGADGVTGTGTDGLAADAAGGVVTDGTDSTTDRCVPVVGASCAGDSLEAPPLSAAGSVTAGTGATMFETVDAAVAESRSAPPPPQAASDVQSSVETTCTVMVREKSVISVSSVIREDRMRIRLFSLSLSDAMNITVGKRIPHGK